MFLLTYRVKTPTGCTILGTKATVLSIAGQGDAHYIPPGATRIPGAPMSRVRNVFAALGDVYVPSGPCILASHHLRPIS